MGIADKVKYQVMLKAIGGEPLTSERTWLRKETAFRFLLKSLDSGVFAWGALLHLGLDGSLIEAEEFFA